MERLAEFTNGVSNVSFHLTVLCYRINEIQSQVHEQSRKRDESMHALDVIQREREHAADNERLKMQGKIAEIAEEVSRKILSKEIRLREEAQQKFANIEKVSSRSSTDFFYFFFIVFFAHINTRCSTYEGDFIKEKKFTWEGKISCIIS